MLRNVVQFSCDICKVVEEVENVTDVPKDNPLPKTWSKLIAYTNGPETLNVDLCPKCMKAIQDAIEEVPK